MQTYCFLLPICKFILSLSPDGTAAGYVARVSNDVRTINDWIAENEILLNKKSQDFVHLQKPHMRKWK